MYRLTINVFRAALLLLLAGVTQAATLSDIKFAELPGERAELRLSFDTPPASPTGYAIEQPARIVLDFTDVQNELAQKRYAMNVGEVTSAVIVEGGGRTRLILNLDNSVPYRSYVDGNEFVVEVGVEASEAAPNFVAPGPAPTTSAPAAPAQVQAPRAAPVRGGNGIQNIDFRRGEVGEGKLIVSLGDPAIKVDIRETSKGIEARFHDTAVPGELQRKLDVIDFATPVQFISTRQDGDTVLVAIEAGGEYDYLAYQADEEYVINVKPLTRQEIEERESEFAYTGERLSLNFQDIPVRNVLQLIADFTGLNLVASDTVSGSITLRLDNVPWDQALDIVLKTKGLDKRTVGNVLMVAPAAEIAERERQELETKRQLEELAPLRTEYIRVRYANARELFTLFLEGGGQGGGGFGGGSGIPGGDRNSTGSILSERGRAIVDERTNSIILTDTEEKIEEFKRLIDSIDIPIRQVMIEARIVIANTDFRRELGVSLDGSRTETSPGGSNSVTAVGDVNLGVPGANGNLSLDFFIGSNFLLDLELSALENAGFAEIVSQPKVITGDKQQATIQSGTEIAFQEESASGGTTTQFKEAVLKLDVTPQITPDNRVIMDLEITQDSISSIENNIPILDITQLTTQVLVNDGETVVLGGIYEISTVDDEQKVPFLGDIPGLGRLFKRTLKSEDKSELLLFITPRIMDSDLIQ